MTAQTMFDKIWRSHEVVPETADTPAVLYIDLHLTHEVTTPQAFAVLRAANLRVRRPERTIGTLDHSSPTEADQVFGRKPIAIKSAGLQMAQFERNCREFGVELLDMKHADRGIVHVIGPELGLTQPGSIIVCGDSHTSTHGAFGALAFGIGTTEVGHVLATQCLLQRKPRAVAVNVKGRLPAAVGAKDLILAIIGKIGIGAGTGCVFEYRGEAVRGLSMEERMTVCNMSIEAGARAVMIAPDETTFDYLVGRPRSVQGAAWERAVDHWRTIPSDAGACFEREIDIDAAVLEPMISYGTNPGMVVPVNGRIPADGDAVFRSALDYMGFAPGEALKDKPVDVVFVGSCTNGRISDLRSAASVMKGKRVATGVRMLVVPGSQSVKRLAEAEGLDRIFTAAGAEWRESGCSMCIGMNGDTVAHGKYAVSTSNRNFEGRQGAGSRTLLASPATAAAAAIRGRVTDPRDLLT